MTLVNVFYTKFSQKLPAALWYEHFNRLPLNLQQLNRKFYRWQDQHSNLFGKLLLLEALKSFSLPANLDQLKYNEYSRPYFEKLDFDFNISHSGDFVLCAIGQNVRIGVDVEKIRDVNLSDFSKVMTNEQWYQIYNSKDPYRSFFKFWTIKESVIKADSRGLSIPLLDIQVMPGKAECNKEFWYLTALDINPDYCVNLAINVPDIRTNIYEINFSKTHIMN